MAKIEFGWFTPPVGIPESGNVPLAIEQQAEILPEVVRHFDSLWVSDHFYAFESREYPWLECWTTATWLAARFPTMRVGQIVMGVGYRHPSLVAKMTATLQALTGGRVILGIGGGWREEEYLAYGYSFPSPAVRIKQLEEAVQIIRLMWTEPAPTFKGQYFQIENAYCYPQPQPLPPIMIGGGGEQRLIPLAARTADIWDLYHGGPIETIDLAAYQRKRDILDAQAEAARRDPSQIIRSLTIAETHLPTTSEDSKRLLDHFRALTNLGITHFILDCGHVTSTEVVARFAEEVIAPLNNP